MSKTGSITMQELERAKIIESCMSGEIKASIAALRLQITPRQVRRLQARFAQAGMAGMVSARRGKPSNNQLAPDLALRALQLVREHYADFGPTLACEHLLDRHGLALSKETLRNLMIEAGLWIPKRARQAKLHQPRERRACLGELVQIDGSPHNWFEQRGDACALLAYIDDATGRILQLHFAETECTASYFEASRRYIEQHGKPRAFYSDRAAVFRSASPNRRTPTQFHRALDQLDIELICAKSPQAKGRVERINRVMQDRLVKELRLDGIDGIAAANAWCDQYARRYNERFARVPRSALNAHVPLHRGEELERILAFREERKLSAKLTIQHGPRKYLLHDTPELRSLIGRTVIVHTYQDARVELRVDGKVLPYATLEIAPLARPREADSKTIHHQVDKKIRNRPSRENTPAAAIAQGVISAKRESAQKRARRA